MKRYSTGIRAVCGVFGVLGIAAIASELFSLARFEFEFRYVAIMFACGLFLFVAATGKNPFGASKQAKEESQD